ncbi:MAG: glycosyltransferase family 2 protein [Clostridiales bacterium]|nr:glycosyltransferase family 2 protein [Clostridiales bacterium]
MLSIIIPSYNEEENVTNTANVVVGIMEQNQIDFELIFINDGSTDNTWEKLKELSHNDKRIISINFSRNFGKESAIYAGLANVSGDCAVLMDCDLQHPPETIVEMYSIWKNNDVDVVEGIKADRGKEKKAYRGFAKLFYKLIHKASGIDMADSSDFKLLDRKVVESLNAMPERLTFFRALSSWVGFKTEKVYFEVAERHSGESKFTIGTLIKYAFSSITSFTNLPMQIVTGCGVVIFLLALIMGVNTLYNYITGNSDAGFTTVILLILLTSSILMVSLGIIGYYLSKIYDEIKHRPRFIIRDIENSKRDKK